ncbi:P-loop containing nucleoside triphosphate hydrolase protein [Chytridium lagenaria]|nr:P-loop containing nucleoside triphosphate hydrolase protein [Chytridium lagenaria]
MEEIDAAGVVEDGNTARLVVAVRIRPISNRELGREGQAVIAQAVDLQTVLIIDPSEDPGDVLRQDRPREKLYAFDHVFSEVSEQGEVFDNTTKCLVPTVLKGYNATVFAYGATGAGKTFTMLGTESNPGIMSNTLGHLFHQISSSRNPLNSRSLSPT